MISGSEISADPPSEGSGGSISRISPLQCALVSLGANGLCPTKVLSVAYLGEVWPEDEMLKAEVTLWSGEVFFVEKGWEHWINSVVTHCTSIRTPMY